MGTRSGVPPPSTHNHCVGTRNHCVGQYTSKNYWKTTVRAPSLSGVPPPHQHTQPLCGYMEPLCVSIHTHNHCVGTRNHCVGQYTSKTTGKQLSEPHLYKGFPPTHQHTQSLCGYMEPLCGSIHTHNHCLGTRNHCVVQYTSTNDWKTTFRAPCL